MQGRRRWWVQARDIATCSSGSDCACSLPVNRGTVASDCRVQRQRSTTRQQLVRQGGHAQQPRRRRRAVCAAAARLPAARSLLTCHAGEYGVDVLEDEAGDDHPQARLQQGPVGFQLGHKAAPQHAAVEAQPAEPACGRAAGDQGERGRWCALAACFELQRGWPRREQATAVGWQHKPPVVPAAAHRAAAARLRLGPGLRC